MSETKHQKPENSSVIKTQLIPQDQLPVLQIAARTVKANLILSASQGEKVSLTPSMVEITVPEGKLYITTEFPDQNAEQQFWQNVEQLKIKKAKRHR